MNCRICHRISATGKDHLDCVQMRNIRLEEGDAEKLPEKLSLDGCEIGKEIRAVLDYLAKEKS